MTIHEPELEAKFIEKLQSLKYEYRPDIRNRESLEKNFRAHFEALNRVRLTDTEFARILDEIVTADVFSASKTLRAMNAFTRDDGTPLNYTLVWRSAANWGPHRHRIRTHPWYKSSGLSGGVLSARAGWLA